MEDSEGMLFLFVGMRLFVTVRRQILFQKKLKAANHKSLGNSSESGR